MNAGAAVLRAIVIAAKMNPGKVNEWQPSKTS
jgi:hypothetical protein